MCDASHDERRNIPAGIWFSQNSITLPKMQVSTPTARKCAAAARPYGPAPMIATWWSEGVFHINCLFVDFTRVWRVGCVVATPFAAG